MNSLEGKLKALGVTDKHITFLKETFLESEIYAKYYEYQGDQEKIELVPVKDIVALGARGKGNRSWWDHATYEVGSLEESRIDRFITNNNMTELSSSQINELFSREQFADISDRVKLSFYEQENKFFVINGNHRIMWAKLLNVPFIRAEVSYYSINSNKYEEHLLYTDTKNELDHLIKKVEFEIIEKRDWLGIYYKGLLITEYPVNYLTIDICLRSEEEKIERINKAINILRQIEDNYNYYMKYPSFIRLYILKIVKVFSSNNTKFNVLEKMLA